MLAWLNRLLSRTHDVPPQLREYEPPTVTPLPAHSAIEDMAQRVRALELDRAELLEEWVRTRSQWIRLLKRQGAISAHEQARLEKQAIEGELESEEEQEEFDLLTLKYPQPPKAANG